MEIQSTEFFNNHGPLKQVSLKDQAYKLIKEAILYRRLQPSIVYSQDTLGQELEISRTPIREALLELQSEGYISFVRGKGFEVLSLSKKEAADIVEMRQEIECIGVRLAAKRITPKEITKLYRCLNLMLEKANCGDPKFLYHLDYEFHNLIFAATDNIWLMSTIKNLRDHFLRVETQSAFDKEDTTKDVYEEHKAIVDALATGDAKKAEAAMHKHMEITYKRTVKNILSQMDE